MVIFAVEQFKIRAQDITKKVRSVVLSCNLET